jgi:hypothetical protein
MLDENLVQQKNWFRFFPDGTIEFTVITRVLAIVLLAALVLVPSAHRAMFLVALAAVIWVDYIIVLCWAVQIGNDLEDITETRPIPADDLRRRRTSDIILLAIPSIIFMLMAAPWPRFLISQAAARNRIMLISMPVLGLAFIAAASFAWKILEHKGLGSSLWRIIILIPGLHWFAMHRLARRLQNQVGQGFRDRTGNKLDESGGAFTAADVTLAICLCFFLLRLIAGDSSRTINMLLQGAGMSFAALFAVIDLAAMEKLQRQYVTLIRKL